MTSSHENFYGLGIAPGILKTLEQLKFVKPTPIQAKSVPPLIEGKDMIGIAQTGTGKTLAFGIPLVQRLAQNTKGIGLVLVPTRELAIQVNDTIKKLLPAFKMKSVVLIGGESIKMQSNALKAHPRVVIATPGRLLDHFGERRIRLSEVNILVLDEADRMLDMGFAPQIEEILSQIPTQRQTMLFSATMPSSIVEMARRWMHLPVQIEVAPQGTTAERITQELYIVSKELKETLLDEILKKYVGSVLLFVRTKRGAERVARSLRHMHHSSAEIHSDRSQSQRKEALSGFKSGKYRILVATDIAARGIDVSGIELVINYDLPDDPENYVHRIGRTGRAGKDGHAITLALPDQGSDVKNIERLIKTSIPLAQHPNVPAANFNVRVGPPAIRRFSAGRRPFGRGRR